MTAKRINPAVLLSLKDALASAFWYRRDLRSFVASCVDDQTLVARIDWGDQYKRVSIDQLVSHLAQNQHRTFEDLLSLVLATAEIKDPQHLRRLEGGEQKYEQARAALERLRAQVAPLRKWRDETEQAARRREAEQERNKAQRAIQEQLVRLREALEGLLELSPQDRGYALERLLTELFELFEIEAKGSFRIEGEQIDGAFTLEGTEYLLEAKWAANPIPRSELDVFTQKIRRKLDNTLGLFVAINGYAPTAISTHSGTRPSLVLMDGGDLVAVLDHRIELPELLRRKRQYAAQTGEIFVPVHRILS